MSFVTPLLAVSLLLLAASLLLLAAVLVVLTHIFNYDKKEEKE